MVSDIVNKLSVKINPELAKQFDVKKIKDLSFIPVNLQDDTFFAAVHQDSDKNKSKRLLMKLYIPK